MKYTKELLEESAKKSLSFSDMCRDFGVSCKGGNISGMKNRLIKNNIDYSHFTGSAWNLGERARPLTRNEMKLEDVLVENTPYKGSGLKKKLFDAGIMENKCSICGITEWQNKPIVIQIDHINGDHHDNRIENLRMLCPNCHSQTETYGSKGNNMKDRPSYKEKPTCSECGIEITRQSKSGLCRVCNAKARSKDKDA